MMDTQDKSNYAQMYQRAHVAAITVANEMISSERYVAAILALIQRMNHAAYISAYHAAIDACAQDTVHENINSTHDQTPQTMPPTARAPLQDAVLDATIAAVNQRDEEALVSALNAVLAGAEAPLADATIAEYHGALKQALSSGNHGELDGVIARFINVAMLAAAEARR